MCDGWIMGMSWLWFGGISGLLALIIVIIFGAFWLGSRLIKHS